MSNEMIRRKFEEFDKIMSGAQDNRSSFSATSALDRPSRSSGDTVTGFAAMVRAVASGNMSGREERFRSSSGTLHRETKTELPEFKRRYASLEQEW